MTAMRASSACRVSHLDLRVLCACGPACAGRAAQRQSPALTPGQRRRRRRLDALGAAKLPAIHFHDLRHTGNTLAANAGASLRELMERMGHDSERAALVYLHSSEERQHQIADTLSKLATEELKRGSKRQGGESTTRRSGRPRARNRKRAS
jgi:hypothetical protein